MAVNVRKKVGVLALQGDFEAHQRALTRAGAEPWRCARPRICERWTGW